MNTYDDFDDDLPEVTQEMINEYKQPQHVDLHLGPAEVKKVDQNAWLKEFGPQPPGPGIIALDVLIVAMTFVVMDLIVVSWMHVFS